MKEKKSLTGLLRLIMKKSAITDIMNYAADLLSSALVIVDNSPDLNFYGHSTNRIPRDPFWAEAFEHGKCTNRLNESVYNSYFVMSLSAKIQGGYSVNPDNETLKYWCMFPHQDSNHHELSIVALPDTDIFSEQQISLLHSFINILSLTYMDTIQPPEIAAYSNSHDLYSAIRGIPAAGAGTNISHSNSEKLIWNNVQIIVMQPAVPDRTQPMWQLMLSATDEILDNHSAALSENRIVALSPPLTNEKKEELQALADKYDLHIGISWPFSSRPEAASHYKQSLYAIKIALKTANRDLPDDRYSRIHLYDQYYHYNLLENNSIAAEWNEYRPPELTKLEEYDRKHNTRLYLTFREYLLQNQHASLTARKLKVHKSTVQHRIEKIQYLLGDTNLSSQLAASLLAAYAIDALNASAVH